MGRRVLVMLLIFSSTCFASGNLGTYPQDSCAEKLGGASLEQVSEKEFQDYRNCVTQYLENARMDIRNIQTYIKQTSERITVETLKRSSK